MQWFSSTAQATVFIGSFYAWAVIEAINSLVLGRRTKGATRRDRGSYWVVALAIYGAMAGALAIRGLGVGVVSDWWRWVGLGIFWLGTLVREWAVLSLGRAFTVVVQTTAEQHLVRSGPYRFARHPAYTGSMLTLCGFGLAAGSWVSALLALAVSLAGFNYRVRVEEKAMVERFGDEYEDYMRSTGTFWPGRGE